ncbi:O-antigen ligase family protein [Magnetococcales bacterium HHB-1]
MRFFLLTLPGLLFFLIHSHASPLFFRIHIYKIFLVGGSVTLLWGVFAFFVFRGRITLCETTLWKLQPLVLLLMAPGAGWLISGEINTLGPETVAGLLAAVLWAFFVFTFISQGYLLALLFWLAITILSVSIQSLLLSWYIPLPVWHPFFEQGAGAFGNINFFTGFLLLLLPLCLAFTLAPLSISSHTRSSERYLHGGLRLLFGAAFVVGALALFASGSRGGRMIFPFITLFVLIAFFYTTRVFSRRKKGLKMVMALFLASTFLYIILGQTEGFRQAFGSEFWGRMRLFLYPSGWADRLFPWSVAWHAFLEAPFFGHGFGAAMDLFFQHQPKSSGLFPTSLFYRHSHSEYLEILQEGGLFAFLCYLLFWSLLFRQALTVFKQKMRCDQKSQQRDSLLIAGIMAGWLGYLLQGIFSAAPRSMVVMLTLYTLIPLVWIENRSDRSMNGRSQRRLVIGIGGVVVLFWIVMVPQFKSAFWLAQFSSAPKSQLMWRLARLEKQLHTIDHLDLLHKMATIQGNSHRTEALINTLDRLDALRPHYRQSNYLRILAAGLSKDFSRADFLAEQLLQWRPYHQKNLIYLYRRKSEKGNWPGVKKILSLALLRAAYHSDLFVTPVRSLQVQLKESLNTPHLMVQGDQLILTWPRRRFDLIKKGYHITYDHHSMIPQRYFQKLAKMLSVF